MRKEDNDPVKPLTSLGVSGLPPMPTKTGLNDFTHKTLIPPLREAEDKPLNIESKIWVIIVTHACNSIQASPA